MSRSRSADKQKGSVQRKVDWKALQIVHADAAGIDVGGNEHWVAISPDRDPEPMRRFGCFTANLREMARWLVEKGIRSVAMQSTGVYWMPVIKEPVKTRRNCLSEFCVPMLSNAKKPSYDSRRRQ
jgi:hypothetical protein